MVNQQLTDFIKAQLQKGFNKEFITKELLGNSWTAEDVEEGFRIIATAPIPSPVPSAPIFNNSSQFLDKPIAQNQQNQIEYAGFWIRWLSYFIDGLVLIIPVGGVSFLIIKSMNIPLEQMYNTSILVNLLITWLYFVLMTYKYQATLGKKAVGIKVFSENKEENLTIGKIILRETVGKILSGITLSIGYMMAGFTEKKQALHDKVAGTVVIYNIPKKKPTAWIVAIIIFIIVIPAFIGFFSAIILTSLSAARNGQGVKIKESLALIIPEAVSYAEKNSSYIGFKPEVVPVNCNGDPVVNISPDGKKIAVFMKSSCSSSLVYFCVNPVTNFKEEIANADEAYVSSGATVCYSEKDNVNIEEQKAKEEIAIPMTAEVKKVSLTNTFNDEILGYEIKYPDGWSKDRQEDKESGAIVMSFIPDTRNPSLGIFITRFSFGDMPADYKLVVLQKFVDSLKKDITDIKGKIYIAKDFTYKFPNGNTLTGEEFESVYINSGVNFQQIDIYLLNRKNLFWVRSVNDINQYEAQLEIENSMINTWVIKK
jgi:uncharacterized RDD family membrane protein YckC